MAFITVNGVEFPITSAERLEDEVSGTIRRGFSNNLMSTQRTPKRAWNFTTRPLTPSEISTLETAIGSIGQSRNVGGTAIGSTIACLIRITGYDYVYDGTISHQRQIKLYVREI